jgi:hypothetical protein
VTDSFEAALDNLRDALAEVSRLANSQDAQPIVTRFYAIVESMDVGGERGIEAFFPSDLALWDKIGLLDFELQFERGQVELR